MNITVFIKNEYQFNLIKEFLGSDVLYSKYNKIMATKKTGIILYSTNDFIQVGSVGDLEYQKYRGFTVINFNDFFKNENTLL
jgi:hypothetical protein